MKEIAGSPDFVLSTMNAPRGRLHFVGAVLEPVPVGGFALMMTQRVISGSPTGSPVAVAAMPSLLPLRISLAAWSSTSDGPLVSPCGRPPCRVAGRCGRTGETALHLDCEHSRRRSPPRLHRVGLADAHEDEVVEDAPANPECRRSKSERTSNPLRAKFCNPAPPLGRRAHLLLADAPAPPGA